MMSSTIGLSIKAANGSIDDYRVDVQSDWTIHQLKNYLYRHYPTHPPITGQKLIHGGRLLLDQVSIEQSLSVQSWREDAPIIIHLVAYEHSKSAPTLASTVSDRLLKSQVSLPAPSPASKQPSLTPVEEGTDGSGSGQRETSNQLNPSQTSTQQQPTAAGTDTLPPVTTNPRLRYRGTVSTPGSMSVDPSQTPLPYGVPTHNFPGFGPGTIPTGGYPFPRFGPGTMPTGGYPFPTQFYMSPYGAAYANQMAQWYYTYYGRQTPPTTHGANNPEDDLDLLNHQEDPNNVELEDDVPVNAAGGAGLGMMAGGAGGGMVPHRRDLVDILYMFTMFGFLALVAYLTGSIGRLVVFAGGIMFMLLNQGGWFSLRRRQQVVPQQQQRLLDVNPLMRVGQAQNNQRQDDTRQQAEADSEQTDDNHETVPGHDDGTEGNDESIEDPVENRVEPPVPLDQQRPGILATLLVFVTSFFTSLVPHQRPELQIN